MKIGTARLSYLTLALLLALVAACFNVGCGGGSASVSTPAPPPPPPTGGGGGSGDAIPPTFFAMTIPANGADYPTVLIGALGHPSTFAWGFIERSPGTFNFKAFDTYVNDAVQHGLVDSNGVAQVTITFGDTPQWAASDVSNCRFFGAIGVCPSPPRNIQDWVNFVTAVINHYNGTTAPHVKYYELWNEAQASNFWTGTQQEMVNMAAAAFPIIHTDPFSQLLTPSVSGPAEGSDARNGLTWMTQYLQDGGGKFADGGTFHGYVARFGGSSSITLFPTPEQNSTSGCAGGTDCFGSVITKETSFRQLFDQNGLKGKPMLDTEGSWGVNSNLPDPDRETGWMAQWYTVQADYFPNITQVSWYTWGFPNNSGQLELSPGAPNEAGIAYGQVYNWLVGATFSQQCASDSNFTWTCPLTRPGGYQALIVWNENGNFNYTPANTYKQFRDLAGNTTPLSGGAITIGFKPLLLENQNP